VALSFNGGKDCTVLLHLFSAVKAKLAALSREGETLSHVPTLYILTPKPFNEIEAFVESSKVLYGLSLYRAPSPMQTGLEKFLSEYNTVKAILIGTRRSDPFSEELSSCVATSSGWPKVMRVHPILDWDYQTVWSFLQELQIPYCRLYDLGYTSLGDQNNTIPNPLLLNNQAPGGYDPAWKLKDGRQERQSRV